uniref:Uncharacterized protein n=1 Tax=Sphenodon punctatus TaxID=8508 RepID=A0A8D0H9J8_SPHPU
KSSLIAEFQEVLSEPKIILEKLSELCFSGNPTEVNGICPEGSGPVLNRWRIALPLQGSDTENST